MWLTVANVAFLAAGGLLYWVGRRRLFSQYPTAGRKLELRSCILVAALTLAAFALAHAGMNYSWTRRVAITDLQWLLHAAVFAGALLMSHLLLRLQRSRADEMLLPIAAFLIALGLVNVYVWEVRDANAYISNTALPAMRQVERSLLEDGSLAPNERTSVVAALGPVQDEVAFERSARARGTGPFATVLEPEWLSTYNAAVERLEAALRAYPGTGAGVQVREVDLYDLLRRQLAAAVLGLLLVPAVTATACRVRRLPLSVRHGPLLASGLFLLAVSVAALATSAGRDSPVSLPVAGQSITIYELLKVGVVALFACALAAGARSASRKERPSFLFALAVGSATVGIVTWLDFGAGLALLAIGAFMTSLVAGRRWNFLILGAATLAIVALPLAASTLDSVLPGTARVRLAMWSDFWGGYHRAETRNQVTQSLARIVGGRLEQDQALLASWTGLEGTGAGGPALSALLRRDVDRIEQELRWRLEALRADGSEKAVPFIPEPFPEEELLLVEAEHLWAALGGYGWAARSEEGLRVFASTLEEAIARLRLGVDRLAAGDAAAGGGAQSSPEADNFQLQRSLFALRTGGPFGVGLGRGRTEALPGLTEDVAFVALGEALGFAGLALVALLVLVVTVRGIERGRAAGRTPPGLLVAGLSSLFGLQTIIAVAGVTGVLPFTGLTFPFISRSGTSLVANALALALVMAISAPPARVASVNQGPRQGPGFRAWALVPFRGAGFPAAFALLLAALAVVQLTGRSLTPGPAFAALPGADAPFLHARDQWELPSYRVASGPILDREGIVLARTNVVGGARVYPDPELAASLGHTLMQLDITFRRELAQPDESGPSSLGLTLVTTIDSRIQKAVHEAIDDGASQAGLGEVETLRGAAVVLDARTGEILALESRPLFSLAELSDPLAWARAEGEDRRRGFPFRYLNRVVHGYYPPGSIFKTVTAAAVLEKGLHTLHGEDFDYRRGDTGPQPPDGVDQLGRWHQIPLHGGPPITDGNHPQLEDWRLDLEEAFAWSCNVAFAQMAVEVGPAGLVSLARRLGFERPIEVPGLGGFFSTLDNDRGKPLASRYLAKSAANLARTGFGQGQMQATPLQMALVAAAIAEGGTVMQPYVVAGWRSDDGRWIRRTPPRGLSKTGLTPQVVEDLREMMHASATYGWAAATKLNQDNVDPGVAGKTGSAEWSEKLDVPHSWYIGYFPAEAPRVALAVIVERAGPGPTVAVRIARRIFAAEALHSYVREAGT